VELDAEVVFEVGFTPRVVFTWVVTCNALAI
jgi:hypothetical protein